MVHWFPGVIALGISLPLYEILQLLFPPMTSVAPDGLDLVLFLVIDKVRWGLGVVFSVLLHLYKWGKKGGVEHRVYCPLRREAQSICHRGDGLFDSEGAVPSWG